MVRFLLIHSIVLAACLVGSTLFDKAEATVAVGEDAERTNKGLTIKTSARHLSTIFFNGQCMNVSCSYTSSGNSPDVQDLTLQMYSTAAASYSILVEQISADNPTPQNGNTAFVATGSFSKDNPNLKVAAIGQEICQFAKFRCVATFSDGSSVYVQSVDNLPFDRSNRSSNEEWLQRVKAFVVEQISRISRKMSNKLYFLEIKVDEILQSFQKTIMPKLNQNLTALRTRMTTTTSRSGESIKNSTEVLQEDTMAGINSLTEKLTAALEQLNLNVDEDISNVKENLQTNLKAKNQDLIKKVGDADGAMQERVKDVRKQTRKRSTGVENRMNEVDTSTSNSFTRMQDEIVTSIDKLESDINKNTKSAGDDHKNETENMKKLFKGGFESTDTFINQQIKKVNKTSTNVKKSLDEHVTEALKNVKKNQREEIRVNITSAVDSLKKTLERRASTLDKNLGSNVSSVRNALDTTGVTLSAQLVEMDKRITSLIQLFQQSLETEVNVLQTKVNNGIVTLTKIINTHVESLGSSVSQTSSDLQNQISSVGQDTGNRLDNLRSVTLDKVKQFDEKITEVLNVTRTNIVNNVLHLSSSLTEKTSSADSGVNENINKLNSGTKQQIGQVSNVLLNIINDISQQQMKKVEELSLEFSGLLKKVSDKLNSSRGQANEELKDSSSSLQKDIGSLKDSLTDSVTEAKKSVKSETLKLQNESTTAIKSLADKVVGKINEISSSTSQKVSLVLTNFNTQSENVEKTNDQIDNNLSILITQAIEAVQNDTKLLDKKFETRAQVFKSVEEKLVEVDRSFKKLGDSSTKSFRNIAGNVKETAKNHASRITRINEDLDKLERIRKRGQRKADDQVGSISHNVTATSAEIEKGLNESFNQVDNMLDWSSATLKQYLRPEICKKGMGFLSSSSLTYVVIPKSDEIDYEFLCDAHTDGGGWIVLQKRESGDTDFYRSFNEYEEGFGTVYHDFWLGLEKIHSLTSKNEYELRVDMTFQGSNRFAQYSTFSLGGADSDYKMSLGDFSGTAGDSMQDTNGMPFTTKDKDNDKNSLLNCAKTNTGGWWYNNCQYANLNGFWGRKDERGVRWESFSGTQPLVKTEMKIRLKENEAVTEAPVL